MDTNKKDIAKSWLRKRSLLKCILIVEMIGCYMAVLTMVRYWRGPVQYQAITDLPLLKTSDFIADNGEVKGTSEVLLMQNNQAGNAVSYYAYLSLRELESIYVQFVVDCPAEYAGNVLHVDLLGDNYDNDEQEYQLTLDAGINEAALFLDPGENPPEDVMLRFFTLDMAEYAVENLQVCAGEALPKVSMSMVGVVVLLFALCGITMAMLFIKSKAE